MLASASAADHAEELARERAEVVANVADSSEVAAQSIYMQQLLTYMDMGPYLRQIEALFAKPVSLPQSEGGKRQLKSYLSSNNCPSEVRRAQKRRLYNEEELEGRRWLREMFLNESDSDDEEDEEKTITRQFLYDMIKIRKMELRMRKKYHENASLNSQYGHYSAGVISGTDSFPRHQRRTLRAHGLYDGPPTPEEEMSACSDDEEGEDDTGDNAEEDEDLDESEGDDGESEDDEVEDEEEEEGEDNGLHQSSDSD